jgi:hypothetical protein
MNENILREDASLAPELIEPLTHKEMNTVAEAFINKHLTMPSFDHDLNIFTLYFLSNAEVSQADNDLHTVLQTPDNHFVLMITRAILSHPRGLRKDIRKLVVAQMNHLSPRMAPAAGGKRRTRRQSKKQLN